MDLTGPGDHHDKQDPVVLESKEDMKKRGLDSPDDADALALTFAQRVAPLAADDPLGVFGRLSSGGFGGPGAWMW